MKNFMRGEINRLSPTNHFISQSVKFFIGNIPANIDLKINS